MSAAEFAERQVVDAAVELRRLEVNGGAVESLAWWDAVLLLRDRVDILCLIRADLAREMAS